jgi:hypothetical protein
MIHHEGTDGPITLSASTALHILSALESGSSMLQTVLWFFFEDTADVMCSGQGNSLDLLPSTAAF